YHHAAMLRLEEHYRRGRPDLVHIALLEAASTPLFLEKQLRICVHTIGGKAIFLGEGVRLPRSYLRFIGLMEQLLKEGVVSDGQRLLEVTDLSFKELLGRVGASVTIGLSRTGKPSSFEAIADYLASIDDPALVIGGFPRGHFTEATTTHIDRTYSISSLALEAHVVIARALYEYEKRVLEK
ncbi:MAG TPA: hypothetical protein VJ044_17190, partial [Candidatus Hodarchaeales archaeon]|nr:hypothetical protein [Candidatus Hodarchaeales archaeon]